MLAHQLTRCDKTIVQGGTEIPIRQWCWVWLCTSVMLLILPIPGYSQLINQCDHTSDQKLRMAMKAHWNDKYRVEGKFEDIWYRQGPILETGRERIIPASITAHVSRLGERKSAVLFHWVQKEQLWTWLFTSNGRTVCAKPRTLTTEDWEILHASSWSTLGARGARQARAQAVFPADPRQDDKTQPLQWEALLERLSNILLPTGVVAELKSSDSDTLVVVPITIIGPFVEEGSRGVFKDGRGIATLSLSAVPFAALPFENGKLIDRFSIVISPGFTSFTKGPKEVNKQFNDPIVLGNPIRPTYPNLPGAEDEAKHVAARLGTNEFVRESATKNMLESYLKQHSASVDFIHLATHGIANAKDPLDKSELVFSDSSWSAREIGDLKLTGNPLVVMSACQTALGKDFSSGTIGLAQAWQRAGASNVVMSLWSVDDTATKELMEQFVDFVASGKAVDKALQAAMVSLRDKYPNPSHWASFSIYGAPERIGN